MKNILNLLLVSLLLTTLACSSDSQKPVKEKPQKLEKIVAPTIWAELQVEGMTCTGCENSINKKVSALAGIGEVSSSHEKGVARVQLDTTQTQLKVIIEAIEKLGYKVNGSSFVDPVKEPATELPAADN